MSALQQELRELHSPDPARLEQLAGDRAAGEDQLEEAQGQLAELEARVPEADAERSRAQGDAQTEVQSLARLEARLSALVKLQEDVQKQGALEPWLAKHELAGLQRLWQKLHVEPGWKPRGIGHARTHGLDGSAQPGLGPRLRRRRAARAPGLLSIAGRGPAPAAPAGLTPLASLLRITDPDLRTLLNEWLAGSIPRQIWPRR